MSRTVNEKIPSLIDVFVCSSSLDENANMEDLKTMKIRAMNELQSKRIKVYVDYADNIETQGYVNDFLQENNVRFVLKLVIDNSYTAIQNKGNKLALKKKPSPDSADRSKSRGIDKRSSTIDS